MIVDSRIGDPVVVCKGEIFLSNDPLVVGGLPIVALVNDDGAADWLHVLPLVWDLRLARREASSILNSAGITPLDV